MSIIVGRLPTIPEYFYDYIDKKINLEESSKCCCPFHYETDPSFSYQADKKRWRCFGSCKTGGDIVDLHRKNYKLPTKEEARKSLYALYGVSEKEVLADISKLYLFDQEKIRRETVYQEAVTLAVTAEHWLELDYFMSKTPMDVEELIMITERWKKVWQRTR